jgi:hypothetical protein
MLTTTRLKPCDVLRIQIKLAFIVFFGCVFICCSYIFAPNNEHPLSNTPLQLDDDLNEVVNGTDAEECIIKNISMADRCSFVQTDPYCSDYPLLALQYCQLQNQQVLYYIGAV